MKNTTVKILGTKYKVEFLEKEDKYLEGLSGHCDVYKKLIAIKKRDSDMKEYMRTMLRHEVIHAFMYESGLDGVITGGTWNYHEEYVDWLALQFNKIKKVYVKLNI